MNIVNVNLATQGDTMMIDEVGTPIPNNITIRAETLNNSQLMSKLTLRHLPSMPLGYQYDAGDT